MSVDREHPAPPVGEEIHLPGPSATPILTAAGITLMVIGTTISWVLIVIGAAVFLLTVTKWIRDVRADIDELPADHAAGHAPGSVAP